MGFDAVVSDCLQQKRIKVDKFGLMTDDEEHFPRAQDPNMGSHGRPKLWHLRTRMKTCSMNRK